MKIKFKKLRIIFIFKLFKKRKIRNTKEAQDAYESNISYMHEYIGNGQ
jgi:hypothetical protein